MVSLGPFPMSLVVLLVAFAIAVAVSWKVARVPGQPSLKVMPTIVDMIFVGVVAARLWFVLQWLPEYLADPWAIIRIGDGGFSLWAGVLAGLAFGTWRARNVTPLRRPLAMGVLAGLASWAVLGGSLALMQRSVVRLPDTELTRLEGGALTLSGLAGRPMVVNLWATWCPPCRREMPVLAEGQRTFDHVRFAFVNQGEDDQVVREYLHKGGLRLRNVVLDPFSGVSQATGARGLPTTLFFDGDGRLVDVHMGELTRAGLAQKLQRFGPAPVATPVAHNEVKP